MNQDHPDVARVPREENGTENACKKAWDNEKMYAHIAHALARD